MDLLATGHRVGKENKGIQAGISPTSEIMVCTQSQESLNKSLNTSVRQLEKAFGACRVSYASPRASSTAHRLFWQQSLQLLSSFPQYL